MITSKSIRNTFFNKKFFIMVVAFFIIVFIFLVMYDMSKKGPNSIGTTNLQQETISMVWEQRFPKIAPLPRTTHATAYIGNNEVLIFGGEVKNSGRATTFWCGNDTWIYNITLNEWRKVNTLKSPLPRVHIPMAYDFDDNVVLLFGGMCNEPNKSYLLNDTWIFNVTTKEWIEKKPKNSPYKQSDSSLVYIGKSNFLMRTAGGETWIYNTLSDNWSLINRGLPIRGSAALAFDPDKNIVLSFGGEQSQIDEYYNDTWEYDIFSNKWTEINTFLAPEERARVAFTYDEKHKFFVLFGGVTSQFGKRFNDTWIYNTTNKNWTKIKTLNTPPARGGYYGMPYDPSLNLFLLFGGRHDPMTFLNATWILKYNTKNE